MEIAPTVFQNSLSCTMKYYSIAVPRILQGLTPEGWGLCRNPYLCSQATGTASADLPVKQFPVAQRLFPLLA